MAKKYAYIKAWVLVWVSDRDDLNNIFAADTIIPTNVVNPVYEWWQIVNYEWSTLETNTQNDIDALSTPNYDTITFKKVYVSVWWYDTNWWSNPDTDALLTIEKAVEIADDLNASEPNPIQIVLSPWKYVIDSSIILDNYISLYWPEALVSVDVWWVLTKKWNWSIKLWKYVQWADPAVIEIWDQNWVIFINIDERVSNSVSNLSAQVWAATNVRVFARIWKITADSLTTAQFVDWRKPWLLQVWIWEFMFNNDDSLSEQAWIECSVAWEIVAYIWRYQALKSWLWLNAIAFKAQDWTTIKAFVNSWKVDRMWEAVWAWSKVTVYSNFKTNTAANLESVWWVVVDKQTSDTPVIPDNSITYAKIQDFSTSSRLLWRWSWAWAWDPQEIVLGSWLSMSWTTLNVWGAWLVTINPPDLWWDQNDYSPSWWSTCHIARLNVVANRDITWFAALTANKRILIVNRSSWNTIKLIHNSVLSAAANRIYCPDWVDFNVSKFESVEIQYDDADSKWRVIWAKN